MFISFHVSKNKCKGNEGVIIFTKKMKEEKQNMTSILSPENYPPPIQGGDFKS